MNALIIEDDRENADFITRGLRELGFSTDVARDGESGLNLLLGNAHDIAIVDIMLPKLSGLELIRRAREKHVTTPIIILSALNQAADKISGLNIGADDYLAKPFALNELIARVNAVLRRTTPLDGSTRLKVRDLCLDLVTHAASRNGRTIDLTPREYKILEYLMRNARRILTPNMILCEVWNCDEMPLSAAIGSRMCLLRKKLCAGGEDEIIHTIRGFGYVLR